MRYQKMKYCVIYYGGHLELHGMTQNMEKKSFRKWCTTPQEPICNFQLTFIIEICELVLTGDPPLNTRGAGIAEWVSALNWLSLRYAAIITLPVSKQRCKCWSHRPKLTSLVILDVKPIIYIVYIYVYTKLQTLHSLNDQDLSLVPLNIELQVVQVSYGVWA